jgi:L-seryl-tRNA(Ser) seleniumtransferase
VENVPHGHAPSVDRLSSMIDLDIPERVRVEIARQISRGWVANDPRGPDEVARLIAEASETWKRRQLQPVINATGVVLHTNLGRAPTIRVPGDEALGEYCNVELDLLSGRRGRRAESTVELVTTLTGAESALIVNNGAAAILLVLHTLCGGSEVIISRGELVEIGGGFRIPELLGQAGCTLLEVGTTNRTNINDYAKVLDRATTHVLKVHPSNFRVSGFTESVSVSRLRELLDERRQETEVPLPQEHPLLIVDQGTGLLDDTCPWLPSIPGWLRGEPGVRQLVAHGADLVTFSADKLLGGPQAGLIVGAASLIDRCARNPLFRALRAGPATIGHLDRTLRRYADRDALAVPFWNLAQQPVSALRQRARTIVAATGCGEVIDTDAVIGGGTLPGVTVPSAAVAVPAAWGPALRTGRPSVLTRVHDQFALVDLRAVAPEHDRDIIQRLSDFSTILGDAEKDPPARSRHER